jgi:transposase-like protein
MGRKSKFTFEQKLTAVMDYLEGRKSQMQIARGCNANKQSLQSWISAYKSMGEEGLITSSKNIDYSADLKYAAVKEYLSGAGSLLDICKKYKIRSRAQLQSWILKYNSHEKMKSSRNGGNNHMAIGRPTTFEERVEIVKFCIENNRDYVKTTEKFKVSYQQVYAWVKKYDQSGVEGLVDRRGKRKDENSMTETEKLKAKNKLLEAEKKNLQMELDLLKKIQELERGRS